MEATGKQAIPRLAEISCSRVRSALSLNGAMGDGRVYFFTAAYQLWQLAAKGWFAVHCGVLTHVISISQ